MVAINVGRAPNDRRLIDAMTATLLNVFPTVHAIDVPGSLNTILVATVQPTTPDTLRSKSGTASEDADPLLRAAVETAVANLRPSAPATSSSPTSVPRWKRSSIPWCCAICCRKVRRAYRGCAKRLIRKQ